MTAWGELRREVERDIQSLHERIQALQAIHDYILGREAQDENGGPPDPLPHTPAQPKRKHYYRKVEKPPGGKRVPVELVRDFLRSRGTATLMEIQDGLDISHRTARQRVQALVAAGTVRAEKASGPFPTRYHYQKPNGRTYDARPTVPEERPTHHAAARGKPVAGTGKASRSWTSDKAVNEVILEALAAGFAIEERGTYWSLRKDMGDDVWTVPVRVHKTPSDHRYPANLRAELARAQEPVSIAR